MSNFLSWLFDTRALAPHGWCLVWRPDIIWALVLSDSLIAAAYFSIPICLVTLVRRRPDMSFGGVFFLFSAFIVLCGTTHVTDIVTLWVPAYGITVLFREATAIVSVLTAMRLWDLMPQALALPSVEQLAGVNRSLALEVAQRSAAENALLQLNQELEQRVEERTTELTLLADDLRRSNGELATFAYVASHDLKSPLRGIFLLSTWIEEDLKDQNAAALSDHMKLMRARIQRMDTLLDDLLIYSRVGRMEGGIGDVDVADLAKNVFDLQSPPPGFTLSLAQNLPRFTTLIAGFEQVLRNLFSNAIKHHDRTDGVVELSCCTTDDRFYEFTVRDDGPGIAPQYHERVFAMFQTLKPRDAVEGSGMGLALVQKIVETSGGRVSIRSDGIRGCSITFTWPREITKKDTR